MPLAKCVRCDKLFNKINQPVCIDCVPLEDADFEAVRNCIDENPEMNAEEVAEASGVELSCVLRMVDAGLFGDFNLVNKIKCGRCGEPAISPAKKLCQGCLEKLNQKMLEAQRSIRMDQRKKVELGEYMPVRQAIQSKKL